MWPKWYNVNSLNPPQVYVVLTLRNLDTRAIFGLFFWLGTFHPKAIVIACEGSRHWFIDGTFRVVPLGFYQLLVLMIYIQSMNHFIHHTF